MKYGLFSLDSGNALEWFDSPRAAHEAVLRLAEAEPDAIDSLALLEFDEGGHPGEALEGRELLQVARGVTA